LASAEVERKKSQLIDGGETSRMARSILSREALEQYLSQSIGECYGSPDKQYAVGWNLGSDSSIVVNRRSTEARLFVPGGGKLELLHGLVRAIRAPGSRVSTLCNPYPGFKSRGRIELHISSDSDLHRIGQYLVESSGEGAKLPEAWRKCAGGPIQPPTFSLTNLKDEAGLHAQLVTFWTGIGQLKEWDLVDTELSMESGRADMWARHSKDRTRHLVIELKIKADDRHVVGQIIDYMACIASEESLAVSQIRGMIICPQPTLHLQRMIEWAPGISLVPVESLTLLTVQKLRADV
jgi:hypothetical protein